MNHEELLADIAPRASDEKCYCQNHFDNRPTQPKTLNGWSYELAVKNLKVKKAPLPAGLDGLYAMLTGELHGMAWKTKADGVNHVFVNPIAPFPLKTSVHEFAHIVLGHTSLKKSEISEDDKTLTEMDAEAVAMLVSNEFGWGEDCAAASRHYFHSLGIKVIPKDRWDAIRQAATTIIEAGRVSNEANFQVPV